MITGLSLATGARAETVPYLPTDLNMWADGGYTNYTIGQYNVALGKKFYQLRFTIDVSELPESPSGFNAFTASLDTPIFHAIRLYRQNGALVLRVDAPSQIGGSLVSSVYSGLTFGDVFDVRIDVEIDQQSWKIWINENQMHAGGFFATSGDVQSLRLIVGNYGSPSEKNAIRAKLSNVIMHTVAVPPSGGDCITPDQPFVWIGASTRLEPRAEVFGEEISYQWFLHGKPIPGATQPELEIERMTMANDGIYALEISTPAKTLRFETRLWALEQTRPRNLSTRATIDSEPGAAVVGFVTRHTGNREFVFRAAGPALSKFGVPNVAADPRLRLFRDGLEISQNLRWQDAGGALDGTEFARVGAFGFDDASNDAAMRVSLSEGAYTVLIENTPAATGTALAEIYELIDDGGLDGGLVNLSARVKIRQRGDNIVLGIVVEGASPRRFLIRAVGPGLAKYGVTDHLQNPKITVINEAQPFEFSNDNWEDAADSNAAARSVGAFELESGSLDAALIVGLGEGVYTVQISGVDPADTGTVLGEIYLLESN